MSFYFPYELREAIRVLRRAEKGKITFGETFLKACKIGREAILKAQREGRVKDAITKLNKKGS